MKKEGSDTRIEKKNNKKRPDESLHQNGGRKCVAAEPLPILDPISRDQMSWFPPSNSSKHMHQLEEVTEKLLHEQGAFSASHKTLMASQGEHLHHAGATTTQYSGIESWLDIGCN